MKINATAHLEYWGGRSMAGGSERLNLVIKFKLKGKLFKVKLVETLADTYNFYNFNPYSKKAYKTLNDYYKDVDSLISDTHNLEMVGEDMIRKYFTNTQKDKITRDQRSTMEDKVGKAKKIKITVDIK